MKKRLLEILICPDCRGNLKLRPFIEDKEVEEGILSCCKCEKRYPIIQSIPRMLPPRMINKQLLRYFTEKYGKDILSHDTTFQKKSDILAKTSKSFGFQWNVFSEMHKEYEKNFLDYIEPLKPSFFKNKLVLDAGCGFGRHTYYAAKYGSEVVGFDLSDAVDAAHKNCGKMPNVHIIQGDIYSLPFRSRFDFIMSIGVLHHLPRPEDGYMELVRLAKAGTLILVWLYGKEGRTFKTVFLERTIRKITVNMPKRLLYYFCYLPAALYQTANILYRFLKRIGEESLAERIPFRNYARFPFRVKLADAYDFLGTPINNYYTREECEKWTRDAKLRDVSVTSLGGRSWRIFGRK
jgi:SAM-dependent methyltransferase